MFAKIKPVLTELWKNFKEVFAGIWTSIKETRDQVAPILLPIWNEFGTALSQLLNQVVIPIVKVFAVVFGETWNASIKTLGEVISFVRNIFTGNRQGAWQNVQNIVTLWKNVVENIFGAFNENLGAIFGAIKNRIQGIWNGLREGMKNICSSAVNWIKDKINAVLNAISSAKEKVSNFGTNAWQGAKNMANGALRAIGARASGGSVIAGQLYRINEI